MHTTQSGQLFRMPAVTLFRPLQPPAATPVPRCSARFAPNGESGTHDGQSVLLSTSFRRCAGRVTNLWGSVRGAVSGNGPRRMPEFRWLWVTV